MQQCHYNRNKLSARLRRSTSLSRSKARTTSGENGSEFFAVGLDDFFGGALSEIHENVKGHRNDSASILDLALTSLRFDAGFLRNISTELYHVLIMLTGGRALRLVLKAAEPEGLEAKRLLVQRYEPVSTVTTVSKLVCLLAITFSVDLVHSLTDFQRRVTSWKYDAKDIVVRFDQHRKLSSKVWRKVVFGIVC